MQKLYTKNSEHEHLLFGVGIVVLFLIGATLFHPTLSLLQKTKHQQKVDQLVSNVKNSDFKMREYWEFREFYSPGSFTFDPNIVSLAGALQFNQIPEPSAVLLTFKSPLLTSTDSIIDKVSSDDYSQLNLPMTGDPKQIFKSQNTLIYETPDKKTHLVFVRSSDEMKQTLGLFDYGAAEDKVLKTKVWLNETTLSE